MNNEISLELDVAELEYDVAGAGSEEAGDSQVNHAAVFIMNIANFFVA